ncbi:MAG: hypothetical protein HQM13_21970 [SAR324 cluster bacterium]|nr:hypothetical protein [SAR324 cluster bacterium]
MIKHAMLTVFLGICGVVFWYFMLPHLVFLKFWNIRFFFDSHDIGRYFAQASWAVSEKRLYLDIQSEYPLFANLIMGTARWTASFLEPVMGPSLSPQLARFTNLMSFFWAWMSLAWFAYVWALVEAVKLRKINLWLWLSPTPLYFALYRFDIYPAVAFFLALYCIQKEKEEGGAVFLGICIALKGYALFLLPAFFLYLCHKRSVKDAFIISAIAIAPFAASHLYVLITAGMEGVLWPYRFHMFRRLNGESTYDAVIYLTQYFSGETALSIRDYLNASNLPKVFQILIVFLTVAMRPKSFEDLVNTFLLGVLGFISASWFYSPQFILWIVPIICFSNSKPLFLGTVLLAWLTYFYFPILHDFEHLGWKFNLLIVVITGLRFLMMATAVHDRFRARSPLLSKGLIAKT